jgi:hypothetical protein
VGCLFGNNDWKIRANFLNNIDQNFRSKNINQRIWMEETPDFMASLKSRSAPEIALEDNRFGGNRK